MTIMNRGAKGCHAGAEGKVECGEQGDNGSKRAMLICEYQKRKQAIKTIAKEFALIKRNILGAPIETALRALKESMRNSMGFARGSGA